jgi:hypothetical protein
LVLLEFQAVAAVADRLAVEGLLVEVAALLLQLLARVVREIFTLAEQEVVLELLAAVQVLQVLAVQE